MRGVWFAVLIVILGMVHISHAQSRPQAYALNCIGFNGGTTTAVLEGFITGSNGSVWGVYATCDSTINGGASQSNFPVIPAGPTITGVHLSLMTVAQTSTATTRVGHSPESGNGYLSGSWMSVPALAQGEVHVLISVP